MREMISLSALPTRIRSALTPTQPSLCSAFQDINLLPKRMVCVCGLVSFCAVAWLDMPGWDGTCNRLEKGRARLAHAFALQEERDQEEGRDMVYAMTIHTLLLLFPGSIGKRHFVQRHWQLPSQTANGIHYYRGCLCFVCWGRRFAFTALCLPPCYTPAPYLTTLLSPPSSPTSLSYLLPLPPMKAGNLPGSGSAIKQLPPQRQTVNTFLRCELFQCLQTPAYHLWQHTSTTAAAFRFPTTHTSPCSVFI